MFLPVYEGELFGLPQALLWEEELDMSHVIFESDYKTIADMIHVQMLLQSLSQPILQCQVS